MERRSFIEGIGLVSAQGNDAPSTFASLLSGAVMVGHQSNPLPRDGEDRVTQLAIRAAREAIAQARWTDANLRDERTAIVIGSSKGPIERWIAQMEGVAAAQPLIGVGEVACDVARALGAGAGPRLTLAAACASGLHALVRADALLISGQCDRAVVIGAESSLHPLFVASFTRLGVLSKRGTCRPFDLARDGFVMSEAAAVVCLRARSGPGICVERGALLSDAHHLTGIDPAGAALKHLLTLLGRDAPFDLIHAHGTATGTNDPVELQAISEYAAQGRPAIYSHKAALGHTQGASGMIGIVLNVLSHQRGIVLPNPNTTNPIPHQCVTISTTPEHRPIRRSLALAAGFGGALAGVSLMEMM